jgi:hypothetical protein
VSTVLGLALFLATLASDEFCLRHLDRQLAWHVHYGLPLPPPDATLVYYWSEPYEYYLQGEKVTAPASLFLAFALDGKRVWTPSGSLFECDLIQCVKPDASLLRGEVDFDSHILAVAAHHRNWRPLALAAIRKCALANGQWDTEEWIAHRGWNHWKERIHGDPGTPLPLVAKYLKRALPLVGPGDERNRGLIRSVELSAVSRNSAPGSDDALIDELAGLAGDLPSGVTSAGGLRSDPRYRAILRRGLAAVPALIAHLDDERITRSIRWRQGLNNRQNLRVKDFARDILEQVHGGKFEAEDNLPALVEAVAKWFADAHKLGEGKYLAARILGDRESDVYFRAAIFWLLTEKYPERLPQVFREVIDTRPNQSRYYAWHYAEAVAEAPIPEADARKVLEYAATQEDDFVRAAGLYHLRAFAPTRAKELLLPILAEMPAAPWPADAAFARIAAEGADADEWKALSLAVRRADPGGRLELLRAVASAKSREGRKHRLALLADYLTDDAVRDVDDDRARFHWSDSAGRKFVRLEVRNWSALLLAKVLQVDAEPGEEWTARQWADLREKARAKLTEEARR